MDVYVKSILEAIIIGATIVSLMAILSSCHVESEAIKNGLVPEGYTKALLQRIDEEDPQ